jgi:hypothetical protein
MQENVHENNDSWRRKMLTSEQWFGLLVDGAVGGALLSVVSLLLPRFTKLILAAVLVIAAVIYMFFVHKIDHTGWLLVEIAGVGIYGTMARLGIRRSPWWLAAGWALHPLWDVALHFFGPGHTFAPISYTIPCLSYDLLVAAVIAIGTALGWRHFAHKPASGASKVVAVADAR